MMHREIKTRKARRRKVTIDFIELNNNSLVLEIGANIGIHSVYISKKCKELLNEY
jgi:hypothetical protein